MSCTKGQGHDPGVKVATLGSRSRPWGQGRDPGVKVVTLGQGQV